LGRRTIAMVFDIVDNNLWNEKQVIARYAKIRYSIRLAAKLTCVDPPDAPKYNASALSLLRATNSLSRTRNSTDTSPFV
jgi:hypothetical protein